MTVCDYTYVAKYLGLCLRKDIKYKLFLEFQYTRASSAVGTRAEMEWYDDLIDMLECTCELNE